MIEATAIDAAVERRRAASLRLLRELVAAGRDGEGAVQDRVAAALAEAGAAAERVRYRPAEVPLRGEFAAAVPTEEREAVLGRVPGRGGGRSLLVFAHPDSEPVDAAGWRRDPFAGAVENGRLFGWGVADDLAGVAALAEAAAAVRDAGLPLAGDLLLASTPSKRHARGIAALLARGLRADGALYLHPAESGAGLSEIKGFASGEVQFRITVEGRPPPTTEPLQTAFAHVGVSPVAKATLVLGALERLAERRAATVGHPAIAAVVARSTDLLIAHVAAGRPDALSRAPAECVIAGALSFPPPETPDDVAAALREAVAEAARADPWLRERPPRVELLSGVSAAAVPPDHPLYAAASEAIRAATGAAPRLNPMHTASDIRNPAVQAGVPTIGLGPLCGDLSQNGAVDEWVDVADYLRTIRVAARVMAAWCGAA